MLEKNMSMLEPTMKYLAYEWTRAFKKSPFITATVTSIVASIISAGILYLDKVDKQRREDTRLRSVNYQAQIKQLEQTEVGIRQLLSFIEIQKGNIREAEDAVASLKKEKESLKPLVESDRAVVDAIFRAQEERNQKNVWRERWIGFAFGVAASLVASFIWFVIHMWSTEKKKA